MNIYIVIAGTWKMWENMKQNEYCLQNAPAPPVICLKYHTLVPLRNFYEAQAEKKCNHVIKSVAFT